MIEKEEYERREMCALAHMDKQNEIKTLSEEQHELIAEICAMRHKLHVFGEDYYYIEHGDSNSYSDFLENINIRLLDLDLPVIEGIPAIDEFPNDNDRYNGVIDNTDEAEEENYNEFLEMINDVCNNIEEWLHHIDRTYSTSYAPTGAYRF